MRVGIEAINAYCERLYIDVARLFEARGLDLSRFENLMMTRKSVGLPFEDPVTHAVNAARPLVENLTAQERSTIERVLTATESGIDFGKSMSTYIHKALDLSRDRYRRDHLYRLL